MGRAKDIIVKPISSSDARKIIKALHYSGKVTQNSQLHFGVFLDGKCGGALQFGPSLDKRKIQPLVADTKWNEFIELNRMALADWLPRNGESRVIAVAMRLLRKHYPHIKWVISFADATQCGDGTIYRASGFVLTGIRVNSSLWQLSTGEVTHALSLGRLRSFCNLRTNGNVLKGYQLRYIYFLDHDYRAKLNVPEIPYSKIDELGAGMYLGKPKSCASSVKEARPDSIG